MERSSSDEFLETYGPTIKCLSLNAADVLFSAAAAAKSLDTPAWPIYTWEAAQSVAALFACNPPPYSVFEEAFEGENKQCQCAEVGGQLFLEYLDGAGNRTRISQSELVEAKEVKDAAIADGVASCNWKTVEGEAKVSSYQIDDGSWPQWYIVPTLDTECCSGKPVIPKQQPQPAPYVFPVDEECSSYAQLIDSCVDRYGLLQNYYFVEISEYRGEDYGCSVQSRFFYWETINGPVKYDHQATGHEGIRAKPPYAPPHPHAAEPNSGGGNRTSLSAVTYTLDAGCTYNQETDDFDTKFTYDVEATNDGIVGLARRMDALAWMINNAQLLPYTTCGSTKPVLEGQWVTTRWESDKKMDHSGRRLRKLFRYRTKSTRDLGQLSAYWEDFTWHAGDVCVIHSDAWWGSPQVWAKSAEEGQRVIRHAASEAGIDPDQVGRWQTSSSHSPRYGMSGNMRILKKEGFPWVASRDGAPWPNVLGQQRDP
jgi:hypothetical protein